ncbi:hypothetical protein KC19_10G135900 [Ceratodon purpureus]|uniref:Secreted protein n=1 Tax=Ceratodon purpureus TaxID=3225 RepID=A0A8T0GMY4_CERPU|nr:hypothetical protein KC19_10G135900 [Ceratodon purpureus]
MFTIAGRFFCVCCLVEPFSLHLHQKNSKPGPQIASNVCTQGADNWSVWHTVSPDGTTNDIAGTRWPLSSSALSFTRHLH